MAVTRGQTQKVKEPIKKDTMRKSVKGAEKVKKVVNGKKATDLIDDPPKDVELKAAVSFFFRNQPRFAY